MLRPVLAILLCCCSWTAAAGAPQNIALALDVNSGGVATIPERGAGLTSLKGEVLGEPTEWLRSVVRLMTNGQYDWAVGEKAALVGKDETETAADPIEKNRAHFSFRQIGDSSNRVLVIANGYRRALTYKAVLEVDGKRQVTDVCTVLPGTHGFEFWPYAIDRIIMSEFRLEKWPKGKAPICK